MTQHRYETDETFSALFGLHDRIHELTKNYLQEVLRSRGELDERVRMLSTVLDSIGDGLTILDREGKVIFVSETARRTVGMGSEGEWLEQLREHYSAYEADGKTVMDREALVRDVLERRKAPIEKECLVVGDRLPSGGLWIRIKSTPVFDDAGNVSGAVNILHNITDLKRASERIHNLYNNAPCGYQSLDDSGTVVDMNQRGLDWIGYSRNEIVGKAKLESLLAEESRRAYHDAFSQLKATGQVTGVRLDLLRRHGPPLAVLWSASVVYKPDGKFDSTRDTLFDISERNALEAQRNTLASLITHDIKNHLLAESILLNVLLKDKHTLLTEPERNLLDVMRDNNHLFLTVTNNLLELYRLEKTGFAAPVADTDLIALLSQVCQLSEAAALAKGVELVTKIDQPVPPVSVNGLALHHAIYNLVDNAIKFSPAGAKLLLSLKKEGDAVVIKVTDQGPGLTPDEQSKLFAAPWSMSWEGSQQISSGLGLYLSKQIIDSQGGSITVESLADKGSTFTVSIPTPRTQPS